MKLHPLHNFNSENTLNFVHSLMSFSRLNDYSDSLRNSYFQLVERKFQKFCEVQKESDLNIAIDLIKKDTYKYFILHPSVAHSLLRLSPDSKALEDNLKSIIADMMIYVEDEKKNSDKELSIFNGILTDFKSDYKFPVFEKFYGDLRSYENLEEVKEKINSMYRIIESEETEALNFIKSNTTLLFFRNDYKNLDSFSSSSYSGYSGLTLITNSMVDRIDMVKLIDAIYHETIHAIIYFYEETIHPLALSDPGEDYYIESPWSGANLRVNQFCQACFVWFGLYHLWNNWTMNSRLPNKRIEHFKRRALKGFKKNPYYLLTKSKLNPFVHQNTKKAIELIQELADSELNNVPQQCV